MATVFRGNDTVLGRPVAVKVLAPRYANDTTFVARFRREAQSAAAMNHPNIVNVFDTGSDGDTHYIVMELVEGRTLREVIAEDAPLLPERAAEIAEAVAAALAFAHERGIVHRDVKPGNIMITPSGDVKVMDFGIARATTGDSLTQTSTVLGTATYLSPEQAQGEVVDPRSDIYSLGIVGYEMLTAQVPFEGESPVAVAYQHVRDEPVRPSALNPDVPDAIERIVLKCMAKNAGNRYANAGELRADLQRFLAGRPVEATPLLPSDATEVVHRPTSSTAVMAPVAYEEGPPERRTGRTIAIVALVIALLAALGVGLFFLARTLLGDAQQVSVPRCINLPVPTCRQLLAERGLELRVAEKVFDDQAQPNVVLTQNPIEGTQVEEGAVVSVTVSRGRQQVAVPDVLDRPVDEARQILEDAGFIVFVDRVFNADVEEGIVFRQFPEPETMVDEGSNVELTVSQGAETVEVPDLTGMTVEEANAALADRGLVLGEVTSADFCIPFQDPGRICDQSPGAGSDVEPGSAVDVVVQGEEPSPSPSPSPTPTESPTA